MVPEEFKAKIFTCEVCKQQFDSSSKKKNHKKKSCEKKKDPHLYLLYDDVVIAVTPELTFKTLNGPPGFTFGGSFQSNHFCRLSQNRIFLKLEGSLGCNILKPDVKRLKFSVEVISPVLTRPLNSYVLADCMATDNEIVLLMGGFDENRDIRALKDTHIYSVKENSWVKGPDLNVARIRASACCLGRMTYIFFGKLQFPNENGSPKVEEHNSIEVLDNTSPHAWRPTYIYGE